MDGEGPTGNVISLYRPGDTLKGVGVVDQTVANLPWPSDVYGNMYFGCVSVDGKLYDAHTGRLLEGEPRRMRQNNMAFNYNEAYREGPTLGMMYRTLFTRCIMTVALELESRDAGGNADTEPDTGRWDGLAEEAKRRYIALAFRVLGVRREMVPHQDGEFIDQLVRPVKEATAAELAVRKSSRAFTNQEPPRGAGDGQKSGAKSGSGEKAS